MMSDYQCRKAYRFVRARGENVEVREFKRFADGSAVISGAGLKVFEGKPDSWRAALDFLSAEGFSLIGETLTLS